jgi:hypothetical protein
MARSIRGTTPRGARMACLLALAGCGTDNFFGGGEVELQVINGLQGDIDRQLTLVVKPAGDGEERRPFPFGDSTNSANWVFLHVVLRNGDKVTFDLLNSAGNKAVTGGECTVKDLEAFGFARAFVSVADFGGGKHVNCDLGFEFDGF